MGKFKELDTFMGNCNSLTIQQHHTVGWNHPGCLPDTTIECSSIEQGIEAILDELNENLELIYHDGDQEEISEYQEAIRLLREQNPSELQQASALYANNPALSTTKLQLHCNGMVYFITPAQECEATHRHRGCGCCNDYKATDVFPVEGYNPITHCVEDLGFACSECLYAQAYGD